MTDGVLLKEIQKVGYLSGLRKQGQWTWGRELECPPALVSQHTACWQALNSTACCCVSFDKILNLSEPHLLHQYTAFFIEPF